MWLLISKKYNRIVSNSAKLMEKLVLRLDNSIDPGSINSTRKYSSIGIYQDKYQTPSNMKFFKKNKDRVKFIKFNDCKLYESDYNYLLSLISSSIEEIKFAESMTILDKSASNGGPALKRPKTEKAEATSPNFLKLKTLRLQRTDLDMSEFCLNNSLICLEILIDERQSFQDHSIYDRHTLRYTFFYIQSYRFHKSFHMLQILKLLPHLTTLKLGWSKYHSVEVIPAEFDGMHQDEVQLEVVYKGPFDNCQENMSGIPKIKNLEIYNLNFFDDGAKFLKFLPHLASSLTALKFTHGKYYMPIAVFMKVLKTFKILKKLSVHIRDSAKTCRETKPARFVNTDNVSSDQIILKEIFVHEHLEELDIFFENVKESSLDVEYIFTAVPNQGGSRP